MVNKTGLLDKEKSFAFHTSCWIQCEGQEREGQRDHYVEIQGRIAYAILKAGIAQNQYMLPDLFIISPFTSVVEGMKGLLRSHREFDSRTAVEWLESHCGTVHTFQGKEAAEVIYMLGCDQSEPSRKAANWVNENNVNVAVTRAKYRVYILGDGNVWRGNRAVDFAYNRLLKINAGDFLAVLEKEEYIKSERRQTSHGL